MSSVNKVKQINFMKRRHLFYFIVFFMFILWVIQQANSDGTNLLFTMAKVVPYHDKVGHFVLYGILALLMDRALLGRKIIFFKQSLSLAGLLVLTFALIEEITQIWIATRTFDLLDLTGDVVGIIFFVKIGDYYFDIQKQVKAS